MGGLIARVASRPARGSPADVPANRFLMKIRLSVLTLLWMCAGSVVSGAVTSAERLLPADTAAIVTIPDFAKARAAWKTAAMSQLWADPAMRKFTEKFEERVKAEVVTPLERELGVKLADYSELFQGQITYAVTGFQRGDKGVGRMMWLLLLDSRDKGEVVRKNLAELKKKWLENGRPLKTDRVRDMETITLVMSSDDLKQTFEKALPGFKSARPDAEAPEKAAGKKHEITVGQLGSLLLVGNNPRDFEKVLIGHAGGLLPVLADRPEFESVARPLFRDSLAFGWANFQVLNELFAAEAGEVGRSANPLAPRPEKMVQAFGLNALKSVSFSVTHSAEGTLGTVHLDAPEATRKGLLKILAMDPKESAPPPFVPADAVKFSRWRQDGQRAWATIETILGEFSPAMAGVVKFVMEAAGKDRDPKFDLRKQLIGNLGNDLVHFEKAPRSSRLEDLTSPPAINLIASPNPELLVQALRTGSALLSAEPAVEREFLGRKIYSLKLIPMTGFERGKPQALALHFAASGGYVALATDGGSIEEYLRTGEATGKALRETAGLAEAAQKVGGMGTGWFGYENQSETIRLSFEAMKKDPVALDALLSFSTLPSMSGRPAERGFREWLDPTLLPPFEAVARYFHFTVFGAQTGTDGITFRTFAPMPPALRN